MTRGNGIIITVENLISKERKMKIPKSVKVGGVVYKVEIVTQAKDGAAGGICYHEAEIELERHPQQHMERVLLHEILHAIFYSRGYRGHDEKQINEVANALHALIIDNPEMFTAGETAKEVDGLYVDSRGWRGPDILFNGLPPEIVEADKRMSLLKTAIEQIQELRRKTGNDDEETLALCKNIIKTIEAKKEKKKAKAVPSE
jgi:hypothetical protein